LKPGVVVHVHDIFWPFEYPKDWVYKGNAWNEAYFLRAFLQFNNEYSIEYFNSYIATHHRSALESKMPRCMSNTGAGIWLRRA
jgi:hypothetical protein